MWTAFCVAGLQYCRSCPTGDFSRFELASAIALSLMCSLRTAVRAWLDYEARLDVSLTAPPSRQVVWHIVRFTRRLHANHANVLATLREKYGKESFAGLGNGTITTDDRNIGMLFWIYDEHGSRAPMPAAQAFGLGDITFCLGRGINLNPGPKIPMDEVKDPNWCASFVGVVAQIDPFEIVENAIVAVMDMRLANRTANAFVAWKRDADDKARAAEIAKSKKNKPVF